MNIESHHIIVGGIKVEVVRKAIKNLHLAVYPPNGRVRVAAPLSVSDDAVRLAVVTRMGWVKRQRDKFKLQPRQSNRAYISGETHYFLGRPYRLTVIERAGAGEVYVRSGRMLEMRVPRLSDENARKKILFAWYRQELRVRVTPLIVNWALAMETPIPTFGIKGMKTKWGTCNIEARRIWLNLELIKKPIHCLGYVIVHELAHFSQRTHSDHFVTQMDRWLPNWRSIRDELNAQPLAHERWGE